ncbi:calcium-binding protein [Microvirga sp. TS319]|uniref:calcium-binding protein n=1 Tax=Microvirga sp. TS319 TaxID=3241165 RepID=UPI00351A3B85
MRLGEDSGNSVYRPALATLPNGGYVIGWREGSALKLKVFDGSGDTTGTVYYVDQAGAVSAQNYLDIQAVGNDGGFAVTWNATATHPNYDLKTRVFTPDSNGNLTGGAVHTVGSAFSTSSASNASMTSHDNGYVATYMQGTNVVFAVLDANGAKVATIDSVDNGSNVRAPETTRIGQSKYVVSYVKGDNVMYQIIDTSQAQPTIVGASKLAGPGTVSEVVGLKNAGGDLNGQFAVVRHIVNSKFLFASFYDQDGNVIPGTQPVMLTDGAWNEDDFMSVTALSGGRIAVAYAGAGPNTSGNGWYDWTVLKVASPNGDVQTLNLSGKGGQGEPRIMEMADGRLAVSWVDSTVGQSDVKMTIVDPRTAAVTVNGTAGRDVYAGTEYNGNVLNGAAGNDKLIGGKGTDQMNGGIGTDTVSYEKSNTAVTVNLATKQGSGGHAAGDVYDSIENAMGSAHNDTLIGDAGDNYLWGLSGDDALFGGAGADTMDGGGGNDTYYVTESGDKVVETAGNGTDTIVASVNFSLMSYVHVENITAAAGTANLSLTGSNVANKITGNSGRNTLKGEGGNDVINGGAGADTMYGGAGNDTFYVDNTGDKVVETAKGGTDTVYTSVSFISGSSYEIEKIIATGKSSISLTGNKYANTITGNAGANKLYGGLGNDVLKGGAGKDTFVFDSKPSASTNVDKILDFKSSDDAIWLDNKYFTKLGSGSASSPKMFNSDMFVVGTKAQDKEDRIIYDKKTGSLYYDPDGTGSAAQVKIAIISNKTTLSYHDFFVI